MLTRILIGLALVAFGIYMVWKTRDIIGFFGTSDWADSKLGGGGTALMYKMIGLILIFIGFIVTTNMWNSFLDATLGSVLAPGRDQQGQ